MSNNYPQLTNQNKAVIDNINNLLKRSGYSKIENKKKFIINFEPDNGIQPFIIINQELVRKTLIIEIFGSPWSFITELTFRYLKELGVTFKNVDIYSGTDNEKLFEINSSTSPNIIFSVQQRLRDRNLFNAEIKLKLYLSSINIGKKAISTLSPVLKRSNIPIKGVKGLKGVKSFKTSMVSPVMFKRSKLSQLAKRDIPEPEPVYVPPPKPEIPEEYNLPILDELAEDEKEILKEILKRPKKKVQSNHIAKHTKLEQEVIRDVLRKLVNKGILKVTSGWYVLKKQVVNEEDEDENDKKIKTLKSSRKKKRTSKKKKTGTRRSSKRSRKKN